MTTIAIPRTITSAPLSRQAELIALFDAAHSTRVTVLVHETTSPGAAAVLKLWAGSRDFDVRRMIVPGEAEFVMYVVQQDGCDITVFPEEAP